MKAPVKETVLSVRNLRKRYPNGTVAVKDISLELVRGEVLGLAGPNGAGKSTLLKLIAGLLVPEGGTVEVCGEDVTGAPERAARHVALMPDPLGVYTDVSSREYLQFFATVFGLHGADAARRIDETVSVLGLGPWMDSEVETLSAGWQRRLALGRALLADAPIMLLDEPAAGLDVGARADLLSIIRSLAAQGRTMIVSSHILPELEDLADRYAVMADGRWAEIEPGTVFFSHDDLHGGAGGCSAELRVSGDAETLAKAEAALAAAGVPFSRVASGRLDKTVLEILKGGSAQ